jgi:hypothetical protein
MLPERVAGIIRKEMEQETIQPDKATIPVPDKNWTSFLASPSGNLFSVLFLIVLLLPFAIHYPPIFEFEKTLFAIFSTLLATGHQK